MNRRSFVRNTSLSFGAIPLFRRDWLTQFMQENPYKMKMLRNDVGIFTEKGGTIAYYISKNNIAAANTYLTKFSKIMRMILENSEYKEVSVADDLKALELYMDIERLRLNNKLRQISNKMAVNEPIRQNRGAFGPEVAVHHLMEPG